MILLPIPFTDLSSRKVRPAIVIGFDSFPSFRFFRVDQAFLGLGTSCFRGFT